MTCLGFTDAQLAELGAAWTAREIEQQPQLWAEVLAATRRPPQVERLLARKELRLLLTGAGSSAYIGECLAPAILRRTGRRVDAVATTDLVAGPQRYIQRDVPTLMVSFARSGNSPESVAALKIADEMMDECHHLVLTCNEEGDLCRWARACSTAEIVLMPPQAHDRGFAMTSSFTSLLLSAARIFDVVDASAAPALAAGAADVMQRGLALARELAGRRYERVFYLGSNELKGLAREAALKLLELTDGSVVSSFDSSLGFRHGPKTIINDRTLVVLFVSNDPYTRQYDLDLLHELRAEGHAGRVLALGAKGGGLDAQHDFILRGLFEASDLEISLPLAMFAQTFALQQSIRLGRKPDNPSVSGTVNRVVQGVKIYQPPAAGGSDVPGH
ncbi:MAG: SIS domain-containing protein [Pseudomonadota bacterium]